jgi:glycosyltransferase involved in cell wall biosynthesis
LLDEFAPDIVHIYHAQNLSSSIISEAVERKIPVVISATDFWFICPVVQLKRPDGKICRGPLPLAVNCLTCYTPALFPSFEEFEEVLKTKKPLPDTIIGKLPKPIAQLSARGMYSGYILNKWPAAVKATVSRPGALRDAANAANAITVPTALMRQLFIENGINPGIIHHVPFGIDTVALEPFQTKPESETLRIGYIGTLYEHKGVDILIKAFLALPQSAKAQLKIFGDPSQFPAYSKTLKLLAEDGSLNSSNISFAGAFPNSELGKVLSELDVLVVPSRWYENTPLVIQSALASKTPVIATNLGGMSELIKHEVNGLLFELNDHKSLGQQLLRLALDRDLLKTLRDNIKPERTTKQMVDQIEIIYNDSL